ncbi:VOC family protein [Paucidesulfovibrio longus]|uniref:VOC family protein n=1 Tax=Paucidesulfovibrio longus TaxID=889 RepID=UPI0003B5A217|nr:VOC family protein [Paucidesulfovibrio longus]
MPIKFEGPAVLVRDMKQSREFYEGLLEQEVLGDHGPHVAYQGGFSIWLAEHACPLLGKPAPTTPLGRDNFELYFESEDPEAAYRAAVEAGADILHEVVEQPWAQRCFRMLDPDGHIVEVGEPLPALVRRLMRDGMTEQQVAERTSLPLEYVNMLSAGKE